MNVIEEAAALIGGDRQEDYGKAEASFESIAMLWTTYLHARGLLADDTWIDVVDVALLMALLKISRHATGETKRDNFVDLIGYGALAAQLAGFDD